MSSLTIANFKFHFQCLIKTRFPHRSVERIPCLFTLLLFFSTFVACKTESQTLFELVPPGHTGIDFINTVEEGPGSNILETEFFYNGGGVAIGDINNDNLPDLYLTANTGENALYINLGNFRFRDITAEAGVSDSIGWTAGTSMADINGDGLLDIYVCKTGTLDKELRRNKLFINNGDLTFTNEAREYGLDDPGYCTQAAFLDYDRDGDLDLYIVNYSVKTFTGFNITTIRNELDLYAGDKLYRNDNGRFVDVSREAGILQNPIGFGLSATVSDLNKDGWPDIFVTNDFIERDYMYINQGDGTFHEEIRSRTHLTSYFSMGSDVADINNDEWPDLLVVDMLPYDYSRRRVFKTPDYGMYDQLVTHGYHRQNMRNMLQVNNGNGAFTEVGRLAGVSQTDWSWAPLMADFDNDGKKDIFITNGFPRFYTNLDYLSEVLWKKYPDENYPNDPELLYDLVRRMPKVKMHNFAFKNEGNLSFTDVSQSWGVNHYAVSNGAAYADLDNNGTLDLIVNNINESPFIFKNTSREQNGNNYLKVRLKGEGKNTYGIGAKVIVTGSDSSIFYQENFPVRGFQSSVEPVLLFGLGSLDQVDVKVIWPDQTFQVLRDVPVNQTLTFKQAEVTASEKQLERAGPGQNSAFLLLDQVKLGLDYKHEGSFIGDRINTPLVPHTLTNLGPALAKGDVNRDGLMDLFIGGGKDQAAALYLQQPNGRFSRIITPALEEHKEYEDIDALFFDANGDGDLDLYVVSGGNYDPMNGTVYQDRLYLNDGFGRFIYGTYALPRMMSSGGTVTPLDIDSDGDVDLFVGGRVLTNRYPLAPRSYLLENNNGQFRDITEQVSPKLLNPGMVTDAVWVDVSSDERPELIITGEWMPIRIFRDNGDGTLTEITEEAGLEHTSGWWNVLKAADLNGDGYTDLIAGNRGLNSSLNAKPEEPVRLFAADFNGDGFIDPVMTQVIQNYRYPVPGRDRLLRQWPDLKEKFPSYASYSTATIGDILTGSQLLNASQFDVHTFASAVFKNNGDGTFQSIPFPRTAQVAPVFDMIVADFDGDKLPDILAAGNNFGVRPERGPAAGEGILLKGDGAFGFAPVRSAETGFRAVGNVRDLLVFPSKIGPLILLARNNETLIPYLYRRY